MSFSLLPWSSVNARRTLRTFCAWYYTVSRDIFPLFLQCLSFPRNFPRAIPTRGRRFYSLIQRRPNESDLRPPFSGFLFPPQESQPYKEAPRDFSALSLSPSPDLLLPYTISISHLAVSRSNRWRALYSSDIPFSISLFYLF